MAVVSRLNRRDFLIGSGATLAGLALAPLSRVFTTSLEDLPKDAQGVRYAEGFVYHDRAGKGQRALGDPGIPGVCVSNGREVVRTDRHGAWRLPVTEDTVLFVIKPSGWKVPLGPDHLPRYHYIHKPAGSPAFKYRGVEPTGPLPSSIDFPLQRQSEPNKFRMVLFGDPQPRNQTEIDYIAHDVVEQAARDAKAVDAKFGLSLGDEMFDVLSLFESLNRTVGTIGIPWYNVVGNHDKNYDAEDDAASTETFQRVFGPPYYAFDYAKVHFVVLDNVVWHGAARPGYHGEFTERQLEFVKNDLALVPKDRLVVIAMHIPLVDVRNKEAFYRLIEDRPHTFSLSAHTHIQAHHFIGEEGGWKGATAHHHLNHATVCGSWWEGAPDERGIPHATMADGGPNGYSIVEFDGPRYRVMFRPASRPAEEQMNIWIPEEIALEESAETEVIVNVFAGSERSVVEMRVGEGAWSPMARFEGKDPFFLKLKELEASPTPPPGLKLPGAANTKHLWKANLPARLAPGTHAVEVRTTDMFGQTYVDRCIVRVV
ncbi:MAG: calcineurin-like phosphoesterase family protein [Fimbriimonadaceae bacterium]|nr:calcineurin-like phosphoesterase family protein [Fimbriimonadaceae bacterium]